MKTKDVGPIPTWAEDFFRIIMPPYHLWLNNFMKTFIYVTNLQIQTYFQNWHNLTRCSDRIDRCKDFYVGSSADRIWNPRKIDENERHVWTETKKVKSISI